MADSIDWTLTTFDGNRIRQHREFMALSFREKMLVIEQLSEVSQMFRGSREGEPPDGSDQKGSQTESG
jgi:hypothetical protein